MVYSSFISAADRLPLPSWAKFFLLGVRDADFIEYVCDSIDSAAPLAAGGLDGRGKRRESDGDIAARIDNWLSDDAHLGSEFTIADLAHNIGISRKRLNDYFRTCVRDDFRTWKCGVRIKRAREILADDSLAKIGKIAVYLGFGDRTSFYRQFVKHTGQTPQQWRLEHLPSEDSKAD